MAVQPIINFMATLSYVQLLIKVLKNQLMDIKFVFQGYK